MLILRIPLALCAICLALISGCWQREADVHQGAPRALLTLEQHARADSFFQQAARESRYYRIKPAVSLLDSVLAVDSTHYLAHFQKGLLLRRLNVFDASSASYRKAILYKDDYLDAWYNLANNAFWQKNFVDAIAIYNQLLERGEAPAFLHNKGRAELAVGNYEDAQVSFERSVELDSTYAYGYASMGALAEQQGNFEAMHIYYNRAVQFEPGSDEYWYKLGMASMRLGKMEEALATWESALDLNAFHYGALFNKGKVLVQQGNQEGHTLLKIADTIREEDATIQRLKRGSERFPEDAYYRHALGNLYAGREQWRAAAREYRIAIDLEPDDIRSMINLGNVHVVQEQFDEAVTYYESALSIEPTSIDILKNLAIVAMRKGQKNEALARWERILEIDPQHTEAKRAILLLKSQ